MNMRAKLRELQAAKLRELQAAKLASQSVEGRGGPVIEGADAAPEVSGAGQATLVPEHAKSPVTSADELTVENHSHMEKLPEAAPTQQEIIDRANEAVSGAVQLSCQPKLPSLAVAMSRLAVSQAKAEQELAAAPTAPKVEAKKLPTPKDPALKSAAELSIVARAKLLKETGEQYESVFPATPWPESYLEDFDADGHLNDLKLLEQQLLTDEELLPTLMIRIHQNLKQYEDLAHLLTEEQIQVIVCAFAKRKNIEIVAAASGKSASTKGRSVQAITKDLTIEQVMGML